MSTPPWLARLLLIVAAFCFLLAAVTVCGGNVFHADARAWFPGFSAALAFAFGPACTPGVP